jgi:hypothetical protein
MVGRYLYGDLNSRTVWTFTYKGETNGQPEVCSAPVEVPALKPANGSIVSFGQDLAGELYLVTQGPGTVYRIDPAN